jgi:surface protein
MEWPTDVLVHFLQALSVQCDSSAQRAWNQLAFLTCKRHELAKCAKSMPRPILLRIAFPADQLRQEESHFFKIPFMQATVVCVDVDWGDGFIDKVRERGEDGYVEHTYSCPGEYSVRVFPANNEDDLWLDHLGFDDNTTEQEATEGWWRPLREIVSLGKCGLTSLSYLFTYCDILDVDLSNLQCGEITDMSGMFFDARHFNEPIGKWNVSNVRNMSYTFSAAWSFNQSIGDWNVSNVTDMNHMFDRALIFNQPIGRWNVGRVTNMSCMFAGCKDFNQPIGDWDVSSVVDMGYMFRGAFVFNQPLGDWNVSQVTEMSRMFQYATAFNQTLAGWSISDKTDSDRMFLGASAFNPEFAPRPKAN